MSFSNTGELTKGYVGFETGDSNTDCIAYDWLRVRKLVLLEPFVAEAGSLEITNLACFFHTTLAEDGSIILKAPETNGYYIPAVISSVCNIGAVRVELTGCRKPEKKFL